MNTERQRANYRRWYQNHRKEYLANRHERLKSDPDFAARRRATAYKYFAEHRDEINAKRRERMDTDPTFAASKKAYDADYWEKLKAGHVPKPRPLYDDSKRVYRQSEAARLIGCSAAAIIKWIREGFIPEPHRENGRRLFAAEQIDLIKLFYSISKHDHDARSKCSKYILENWSK